MLLLTVLTTITVLVALFCSDALTGTFEHVGDRDPATVQLAAPEGAEAAVRE